MPSLVELSPVVNDKKIFKSHQIIFFMYLLSPLEKGHELSSFSQGCFMPSLVEMGLMVLKEKTKCEKFMSTITDKFRSEKLT